jgi:adenylate kinase family enzyme
MRKVLVIGSGGAGKTALATKLGELLGLPVIHLDSLFWKPGWVETPKPEWKSLIENLVKQDSWIMDGNYGGTIEERLKACDTVVFLAFPRILCLYRVIKRALVYRGKARPDLSPGCPEQLPDREFLSWIWTYPKKRMPKILEMLQAYEREKQIFILRSPSEVRRFLTTIQNNISNPESLRV